MQVCHSEVQTSAVPKVNQYNVVAQPNPNPNPYTDIAGIGMADCQTQGCLV